MRSISLVLGLVAVALTVQPLPAQEKFPAKPIKVLIPFGPGGAPDIVARVIGDQVRSILGQPFVIENKPGAFGILATEEMARSRPDGHTLMLGNVATNAMTPIIHRKKMTIDYTSAVVPVARLTRIPSFLAITPKIEPKTVAEFIAYAKSRPGQIRYNTAGAGSFVHVDNVAFARKAGLDMVHIPVKSGAVQMMNDIILGDVHVSFLNVATSAGQVRAGGVRALAVTTDQRLPDFPDVPTMAGGRFAGIGTAQWQALFAPAGTPAGGARDAAADDARGAAGAGGTRDVRQILHRHRSDPLAGRGARLAAPGDDRMGRCPRRDQARHRRVSALPMNKAIIDV